MAAGVKSTALRLGDGKGILGVFYALAMVAWLVAGKLADKNGGFFVLALLVAAHFVWQIWVVNLDLSTSCRRIFKSNAWLGGLLFIALILS